MLDAATMYQRLVARDPASDGAFYVGVRTTGIFCRPTCSARKPRPENVTFYPSPEAARRAGFRPCRRCHPEDFARGQDPDLDRVDALGAAVRKQPADFTGITALRESLGVSSSWLFDLLRDHWHVTPAAMLRRARTSWALDALVRRELRVTDAGYAAGFQTVSTFYRAFQSDTGLTPAAARELRTRSHFTVTLPRGYSLAPLLAFLGRDPTGTTDRVAGDCWTTAAWLEERPALLRVEFARGLARVSVQGDGPWSPLQLLAAHRHVAGVIGLGQDPRPFEAAAGLLGFARLTRGRTGLRVPGTPTPYDALAWAIIGQQVNLRFASELRRAACELASPAVGGGMFAPPRPSDLARLDARDLVQRRFSRSKAAWLVDIARGIADRSIPFDRITTASATTAARLLGAIRGLGLWSVGYFLLRGRGFLDAVPIGDASLATGLQKLLTLDERPTSRQMVELLTPFRPWRGLATAHIWKLDREPT